MQPFAGASQAVEAIRSVRPELGQLEPEDELLVIELAKGLTRREAAESLGRSERWVYDRLARAPEVAAKLRAIRLDLVSRSLDVLVGSAETAAKTMRDLLGDKVADSVRLAASKAIIDNLMSLSEHADLIHRISDLEARIEESRAVDYAVHLLRPVDGGAARPPDVTADGGETPGGPGQV